MCVRVRVDIYIKIAKRLASTGSIRAIMNANKRSDFIDAQQQQGPTWAGGATIHMDRESCFQDT